MAELEVELIPQRCFIVRTIDLQTPFLEFQPGGLSEELMSKDIGEH